jgi:hypothetical protein
MRAKPTPLITFWTQFSAYHEFGRGPIPGLVREKARVAPELAEVTDDLSVIEKHRGVAVIVGSGAGMLAWSS